MVVEEGYCLIIAEIVYVCFRIRLERIRLIAVG